MNNYRQCANPDGVFAVHHVRREPVRSSTTSPILADLHHRRRSHPHQWQCARVDETTMLTALTAGGYAISILPDSLPKASTSCK